MAFERLIQTIRQIKHDLEANREADATRIVLDQIALTKLRVQTKGESASGAAFAPYVPPYSKERKKAGYQVGYVDFTRTGRMWAAVRPVTVSVSVFSATIGVQGADQRAKDIIAGAYPKRGNITEPSREEIELSRKANQDRVKKYFQI
jgi:hypothetical protein